MTPADKVSAILGVWNDVPSLKARIEKLTGKMVSLRSRAKYNENQRKLQKNYRDQLRKKKP